MITVIAIPEWNINLELNRIDPRVFSSSVIKWFLVTEGWQRDWNPVQIGFYSSQARFERERCESSSSN